MSHVLYTLLRLMKRAGNPTSGTEGDLYYDSTLKAPVVRTDTTWATLALAGAASGANFTDTDGGGGDTIYVGSTAPSNPTNNDIWITPESTPNVPIGAMIPYVGSTAPTGWLLCNAQAVSRTTYSELFALVGSEYGNGDGSTTFQVPQMSQPIPYIIRAL